MSTSGETDELPEDSLPAGGPHSRPGVAVVFSRGEAVFRPFPFGRDPLVLGRELFGASFGDESVSRRHAELHVAADGWHVRDLGSLNGTFVDGSRVDGEVVVHTAPRAVRLGETIVVLVADVAAAAMTTGEDLVVGSALRASMREIERAAAASDTLLVLGESGTGKELAARRFHELGPNARGPFVAVNCAAIPEGLAERLLFGAKRGAYSGANADMTGHVQAADFGVLFLDEVGELDLGVQAKLLRVLETREVVPLGASHGTRLSTRICLATHRDLRAAVADGRFRSDLYHRIAPPEVTLPPLRERLDEITHHVARAIADVAPGLAPHAKLVEACLLRHWPGNVRELRKHLRDAASVAMSDGATRVRLEHLAPGAGEPFRPSRLPPADAGEAARPAAPPPTPLVAAPKGRRGYVRWSESMTREQIEAVLVAHDGNVSLAARSLGMARSQFYRQMERFDIRPGLTVDATRGGSRGTLS